MSLRRQTLAVAAVAAAALAGCGGATPEGSAVPRPDDLGDGRSVHALMPTETTSIAYVDLEGIRGSDLYEVVGADVEAWATSIEEMGIGDDESDEDGDEGTAGEDGAAASGDDTDDPTEYFEIMGDAAWVAMANRRVPLSGGTDESTSVTFVAGELDEADVRRLVRLEARALLEEASELPLLEEGAGGLLGGGGGLGQMGESEEESEPPPIEITSETMGDRSLLVANATVATELVPNVWLVGDRALVTEVIARAQEGRELPVQTRTSELDAALGTFDHSMAVTVVDLDLAADAGEDESILDMLRGEDEGPSATEILMASVEGVGFYLDMGEGVDTGLVLRAGDDRTAGELTTHLQGEIEDALAGGTDVFGLHRLLRRLTPEREGRLVRMGLSLDRAESYLYWGKISGVVGAGLFVVQLIAGFFSGLGDSLEDIGTDEPQADTRTREGTGLVTRAGSGAPVAVGDPCTIRIEPGAPGQLGYQCRATVTCGGKTLYGGPQSGYLTCFLGPEDDPFVSANDTDPTSIDGDASFTLDTVSDVFLVNDDAQGAFGAFSIEGELQTFDPVP